MDLSVLYNISYGMYLLGVMDGNKPSGCIVNSVMQITSKDPIMAISINQQNYSFSLLKKTRRFSISILSEDTDPKLISRFGFYSGKEVDKFSGFDYEMFEETPIITKDACGVLVCEVLSIKEAETHAVVLARLIKTKKGNHPRPLTYSYYHQVMKGKTSQYAPTFQEEKTTGKYVCDICGYQHDRDIELEDDTFRCPVCGATKDHFYKK
ncbi:MAG TPA: flavin reductase [Bacilli bacterium]|nr:MAG: High molecular weight rubredoxin [Tenericutes bacterium ADurb.BinA124]HNZ50190.1 flavin reductase [Bacilli bacterium]HPX83774.1 flavin reductase [Bacilli bacterium]HQC73923.1 flavin reductase [Bacilli bacterium]